MHTLPETTYVVIHWRGNIPLRVNRLDNPTAAELLTEQMLYAYGSFAPVVQTLTGESALKLFELLGAAVSGVRFDDAPAQPSQLPSWKGLSALDGVTVYQPGDPAARDALVRFRTDGPMSGVMVSHPQYAWRSGAAITPADIDWTGFDDA